MTLFNRILAIGRDLVEKFDINILLFYIKIGILYKNSPRMVLGQTATLKFIFEAHGPSVLKSILKYVASDKKLSVKLDLKQKKVWLGLGFKSFINFSKVGLDP